MPHPRATNIIVNVELQQPRADHHHCNLQAEGHHHCNLKAEDQCDCHNLEQTNII